MAGSERLHGVQHLRAVAALMVVVHHAKAPAYFLDTTYLIQYGAFAWGVDIFFVVSGFIMAATAVNDSPRLFFTKRLVRIVPLYWAATVALLARNTILEGAAGGSARDIVLSVLFVPHYAEHSGELVPYLVPGWTLNYEMFFYLVFGIGLALRRPAGWTVGIIGALVAVGLLVDPRNAAAFTYTNPLMLEFLAGVLVALAYRRGHLRSWHWTLAVAGGVVLFSLPAAPLWLQLPGRLLASALVVLGVVAVNARTPVSRFAMLLGDASYSIYLTHTIVLFTAGPLLFDRLHLSGTGEFVLWVGLSIVVSSGVGILTYWSVERPVLRLLRRRLTARGPSKPAAREPSNRVVGGEEPALERGR